METIALQLGLICICAPFMVDDKSDEGFDYRLGLVIDKCIIQGVVTKHNHWVYTDFAFINTIESQCFRV